MGIVLALGVLFVCNLGVTRPKLYRLLRVRGVVPSSFRLRE